MSCPYVSYLLLLVIRCDMMIQYKKPMSEKYVFCSVLILLFLAWQKMLFHGNSQASVPFGTLFSHYFVTLKFFSQALLCVPALLAALCWNKNIIIPRCEKVIKKSLAAASEAAENLLSFIKNPGNSWDIFLLSLDLLLSRLHTVAKLHF